jgi:hypothetical protein
MLLFAEELFEPTSRGELAGKIACFGEDSSEIGCLRRLRFFSKGAMKKGELWLFTNPDSE